MSVHVECHDIMYSMVYTVLDGRRILSRLTISEAACF